MPIANFHNEILYRSDPNIFPVPTVGAHADLEYAIKDNNPNIGNSPQYDPEPSTVHVDLLIEIKKKIKERLSADYETERVRWATNNIYGPGLFDSVAVEHRKTLAQIRARQAFINLPQAEKERIEDDAMDFFARRYTSFVAIIIASDTTTTAANPRSLSITTNEPVISNADSDELLILPDFHIVSTYTGPDLWTSSNYLGEGFDFDAPLLRADPVLRAQYLFLNSGGEPSQIQAKTQLLTLNQQRWGVLRQQGISGSQ